MADALPFFVAESGTYSSTGPSVALSGTAAWLNDYPARTFASAAADTSIDFDSGSKCTVVVVKNSNNYKRYVGATWTSGSPSHVDLSTGTLEGAYGSIANSDTVTVFGGIPSDILTGALAAEAAALVYKQDAESAKSAAQGYAGTAQAQAGIATGAAATATASADQIEYVAWLALGAH